MAQATIWNPNTGQKQVITAGSAMPAGFSLWTGGTATGAQAQAAIKQPTIAPPAGSVAINGAQYNTGALQKANFTGITPIGNTLYGTPIAKTAIESSARPLQTSGITEIPAQLADAKTTNQNIALQQNAQIEDVTRNDQYSTAIQSLADQVRATMPTETFDATQQAQNKTN